MLTQTLFAVRRPSLALRCAIAALLLCAGGFLLTPAAHAQPDAESADPDSSRLTPDASRLTSFDIPAQDLSDALSDFARQSGQDLLYRPEQASGRAAAAVEGSMTRAEAMRRLLSGTGLQFEFHETGSMLVGDQATLEAYRRQLNSGASVAGQQSQIGQRQPGIEEIIVTGQKREERIQDVPIAISAFSAEDLEAQKLEGGFDLLKAIPNVSFSKTNFTSYNFQIRGVGTQSISATSDPGVAVAFNNTAIIQNRLFEQEYLDVERVEVLRGPQGTLYGRNATAGVINVISNKPELGVWDGMLDVEMGNYNTRRLRGHFNMPLGDEFALRGAYASTKREGYVHNTATDSQTDGRDLWTGRLSLRWQPTDRLRADLIYERFEEDDDRLRTGKQLCHHEDGPEVVGETSVTANLGHIVGPDVRRALFGQGCKPGSLYTDEAFGTPNGLSYNFVLGAAAIKNTYGIGPGVPGSGTGPVTAIEARDPYGGLMQSRDLREITSFRDPHYRAEADLFELNIDFDLTDTLQLSSQTMYNEDETFSFQDFNRFNSEPVFTDTSELLDRDPGNQFAPLAPGGVFCDPQIGCSDTVAGFDIAQASAEQFNQEFRLQSSFSGPLNFSVGANYTEFETLVDYYVMFNLISAMAQIPPFNSVRREVYDPETCWTSNATFLFGPFEPVPTSDPNSICPYIDPNPVDPNENFEGDGHNYFRSKNPYELESWAGFGELYWNIRDDLKLTAGLRYTNDEKTFTQVPSQVLLAPGILGGGTVPKGYPVAGVIEQEWGEWTGRLVLDWQPVLDFTDETLVYGSFSRGYKGGGANPPTPGFATEEENIAQLDETVERYPDNFLLPIVVNSIKTRFDGTNLPVLELTADEYGETFEPEFVNAYEIGTKNTLFGGAMTLNATAFYYDYTDYQVSQIRDRTAVNENFDAEMWGLELETIFVPSPNWQFLANVGYLQTEIAGGETSIDIMNRTQGNPNYQLVKPWAQLPSNCVVPVPVVEHWLQDFRNLTGYWEMCDGVGGALNDSMGGGIIDPATGEFYDPLARDEDGNLLYPEINGGAGLDADLGGNELPQSPNLTVTLGGQYSFDLTPEWRSTVRMDYYWQDESYHRVYNTEPYDRLKSWSNTNLSFWVNNANTGITIEAYVKNLFNQTPITGAFLNSDDTGLTTNVFMFDPRLIGVSVRKEW